MTVDLGKLGSEGGKITDEGEKGEISRAIVEAGILLIFHPSGAVWQVEGGNISITHATFNLLAPARSSVMKLLVEFDITDDLPRPISAKPTH